MVADKLETGAIKCSLENHVLFGGVNWTMFAIIIFGKGEQVF